MDKVKELIELLNNNLNLILIINSKFKLNYLLIILFAYNNM